MLWSISKLSVALPAPVGFFQHSSRPLRASFPHIAIKMKTPFRELSGTSARFSLLYGDHIYSNPIAGCCPTHIAWKNLVRATSIFRFDIFLSPFRVLQELLDRSLVSLVAIQLSDRSNSSNIFAIWSWEGIIHGNSAVGEHDKSDRVFYSTDHSN